VTSNDHYVSFLIRLQVAQNDNHPTWLASLQSTKTGELRWFPNVDGLIQYFQDEFGDCDSANKTETTLLSANDNHEPENRQIDTEAGE
jgi:hypothetical protein